MTEVRVSINSGHDVITARQRARSLAADLGFSAGDLVLIATAVSELVRNIVRYAGTGEIVLIPVRQGRKRGLTVVARDEGPGIANVELALQGGYSTSGGLGLGLPGVRRLMDDFEIKSELDKGTMVKVTKWLDTLSDEDDKFFLPR